MSKQKKQNRIQPLSLLLLTASLTGCQPEEPKAYPQNQLTVEYAVDRPSIKIGDPVELVVTAYFPTNGTLSLPEIGREKDVVLLSRDWVDVPREDGLTQSESHYSITSFRLGEHLVSTGTISCAWGEQLFSTHFPQVTLEVSTALGAETDSKIADIKGPQKLPGRIPGWIWIALGSALAAFLIGLLTSKLWKNRKTLIPSAPPIPPHIIAFKALQALKSRELLEKDECNPFYTELSLILRTYLEGRFNLNAPDATTEEIATELSRSPELNEMQKSILQEFMRQADMVKFAKGHPNRITMETAFDSTQKFVEETQLNGEQNK